VGGIRKPLIAGRIISAVSQGGCTVIPEGFLGPSHDLPWSCSIRFPDGRERRFNMYFWTVSHGGKSRSDQEYRIQVKLKAEQALRFGDGTTLLLGYYNSAHDRARDWSNLSAREQVELFLAWDPLQHIAVGASSSCQASYGLLSRAFVEGVALGQRRCLNGSMETVMAFSPDRLAAYLGEAAGGHNSIDCDRLLHRAFGAAP
jgi:hypothetical protein